MADGPFIEGNAPKPGGKGSEKPAEEWKSTEKPKKTVGFIAFIGVVLLAGVGMVFVLGSSDEEAQTVEERDKTNDIRIVNGAEEKSWVTCTIGDVEADGQKWGPKPISPKSNALVQATAYPVVCTGTAGDAKTEIWKGQVTKPGGPEGTELTVTDTRPKSEEAPAEGAEEAG